MAALSKDQINVDLFDEVQRLKKENVRLTKENKKVAEAHEILQTLRDQGYFFHEYESNVTQFLGINES